MLLVQWQNQRRSKRDHAFLPQKNSQNKLKSNTKKTKYWKEKNIIYSPKNINKCILRYRVGTNFLRWFSASHLSAFPISQKKWGEQASAAVKIFIRIFFFNPASSTLFRRLINIFNFQFHLRWKTFPNLQMDVHRQTNFRHREEVRI